MRKFLRDFADLFHTWNNVNYNIPLQKCKEKVPLK